ncbi:PAS-domain containing protein [Oceaniglobus indicus]|uniref:PAS-domain containing protein n=1 Tax=Oceaniglobus indicus TaxID=2047749 RepID=UPI000C19A93E|nr:PAS-domain containing protein [Oceaniglobus indicus]
MNLSSILENERRARLAAERLLDMRQRELKAANRKLADHARTLSAEIIEQRDEVAEIRSQSESLHGDFVQTREDLERARAAADTAETRLWAALQSMRDGFAMFDHEHRLIVANNAYLAVFDGLHCIAPGIAFHEMVDLLIDEGIVDPQGEPDAWRRAFKARWDTPEPEPAVLKLWNGQFVKLLDRRTPDGGMVTLGINQTESLRTRAAIEAVPDGFVVFDQDDRLIMSNERYRAVFPDSAAQIVPGTTFEDILRLGLASGHYKDAVGREEQWLEERMNAHRQGDFTLEQQLGDDRWLRIIERVTPDGGRVGLRIDITAAKQQQAALERERARAEAANRAKSNFLANMSHEIRTPMNGVIGMIDMLAEGPLSDEQKTCAETIKTSGQALLVIINDILDFSKIEAGKMQLEVAPFDLEECLHATVRLLQPVARNAGLPIVIDFAADLSGLVTGDEGRVRQIVTNLVGNAIKFTENGHITVRVARDDGDGCIVLEVEDTGIGIPADKLDHVFGVFNQVDDGHARRFDGTGLGLAIARELVGLMGGTLDVTSRVGKGSVFSARLPLAEFRRDFAPARISPDAGIWIIGPDTPVRAALARQVSALGGTARICPGGTWPASPAARDVILALRRPPEPPPAVRIIDVDAGLAARVAGTSEKIAFPATRRAMSTLLNGAGAAGKPPSAASPPLDSPRLPANATRLKVLAAEDNKTNRLVLERMLKDADLDLTVVNNGAEVVEAFTRAPPDLVFMDISMPLMDGREATRRIRALEAANGLNRVPIHAMTAHALSGDVEDSRAAGIDSHLTKPLSKARLLAVIDAVRAAALPDQVDG